MSIFFVDVETDLGDQTFLLEADDFISAAIKVTDFLRELDERVGKTIDYEEAPISPSRIKLIQDTDALWANEDGIKKHLENVTADCTED